MLKVKIQPCKDVRMKEAMEIDHSNTCLVEQEIDGLLKEKREIAEREMFTSVLAS